MFAFIEPKIQPLEGESFDYKTTTTDDEAGLDIKANKLWESRFCRTFFDVKIFNPLAKSCPKNINEAYPYHENQKKLKYEQRVINVEKSTFNPLEAQDHRPPKLYHVSLPRLVRKAPRLTRTP